MAIITKTGEYSQIELLDSKLGDIFGSWHWLSMYEHQLPRYVPTWTWWFRPHCLHHFPAGEVNFPILTFEYLRRQYLDMSEIPISKARGKPNKRPYKKSTKVAQQHTDVSPCYELILIGLYVLQSSQNQMWWSPSHLSTLSEEIHRPRRLHLRDQTFSECCV